MFNTPYAHRLLIGAFMALSSAVTLAQTYPSKPVRLVVPFPAGTGTDLMARLIGQQLQVALGQPFVVDNKPGAGGSIGAMEVVRAAPDGYTLLFCSNSAAASNVALLKSMPYDPIKDLTPVAGIGEGGLVLMVRSDHPAKNLQEFLSQARQRPGKINAGYGSSSSQISIAMLNKLGKLDSLPVPYKGIPLAVNDLIGGQLEFTFVDTANAIAQSKGGKLRALGITTANRSQIVPDWPALSEAMPGFDITAWFALLGPANMPREVVEKLNQSINQVLRQNETKEKMAASGVQPLIMTTGQLKNFVPSEVTKWIQLAKDANIQPE